MKATLSEPIGRRPRGKPKSETDALQQNEWQHQLHISGLFLFTIFPKQGSLFRATSIDPLRYRHDLVICEYWRTICGHLPNGARRWIEQGSLTLKRKDQI